MAIIRNASLQLDPDPVRWPNGVTPPVDCDPIPNDQTVGPTDLLWDNRNRTWRAGLNTVHGMTPVQIRQDYTRYSAFARSRYTRDNQPPPPEGFRLLTWDEIAFQDGQVYFAGGGWSYEWPGHRHLRYSDESILALAMPAALPDLPLPAGYERVELQPTDQVFGIPYLVLSVNGWVAAPHEETVSSLGGRPVIRFTGHRASMDGLPIEELPFMDRCEPGTLIFDLSAGAWMPYIGSVHQCYEMLDSWCPAFGRIKQEFRAEGFELLPFHTVVTEAMQVLVNRGAGWAWGAPDAAHLNTPAWHHDGVFGLRQVATTEQLRVPVESFLSAELVIMLNGDAGSDIFRGLVRRDHHMIIPAELHATGDSAAIKQWLEEKYAALHPDALRNYNTPTRRVYTDRLAMLAPVPATPPPHDPDNHVRIHFSAAIDVDERARITRRDQMTGHIDIPRHIYDDGEDAVRDYIRDNYQGEAIATENREGDESRDIMESNDSMDELETDYRSVYEELHPEDEDEPDENQNLI